MAIELLVAPAAEPVTLEEAKAHLRVVGNDEDALITSLVTTSRLHIEAALDLALISQTWRLVLDCWPIADQVPLPLRPLAAVAAVRIKDAAGVDQLLDPVAYAIDTVSSIGRITTRLGYWPSPGVATGGIEIDFTAGFGPMAADIPAPIRQALLLLVAHWYENREPAAVGSQDASIPASVSSLLAPYRVSRL